jgi:hypothetical protein
MLKVVTVEHEWTPESAEVHQDLGFCPRSKNHRVTFESINTISRDSIHTLDLVRLQMNVNWMPPATALVP